MIKDENTLSILTNNWIPLIQLASQHASIDTFAKKLYLTNDVSSLWKLKIILSAYFIHEQSVEHESEQTAGLKSYPRYSNQPVDPRYDFFMAALLRHSNDRPTLPENLKIITWNYDSQIEMAYHPYGKIGHNDDDLLRRTLNIFPCPGKEYTKGGLSAEPSNIIKLNGTAAILYSETASSMEFKSYRKLFYKEAIEQILMLIRYSGEQINNPNFISHGSSVNFAWELEENWISKNAVTRAKDIITESDILVVIGYSFPVFNRDIDRTIFGDNSLSKVYIQDTEKNILGVQSRAKMIMNLRDTEFELDTNLDQFLIPFEL